MIPNPSTPGSRLRAAREERGLTAREAGTLAGVSHQRWLAVEADRPPASLDTLRRLAMAIGADPHAVDERLASTGEEG